MVIAIIGFTELMEKGKNIAHAIIFFAPLAPELKDLLIAIASTFVSFYPHIFSWFESFLCTFPPLTQ